MLCPYWADGRDKRHYSYSDLSSNLAKKKLIRVEDVISIQIVIRWQPHHSMVVFLNI